MSIDQVRQLTLSVRNRGRWGPDDEIGTLNYIKAESIAAALPSRHERQGI